MLVGKIKTDFVDNGVGGNEHGCMSQCCCALQCVAVFDCESHLMVPYSLISKKCSLIQGGEDPWHAIRCRSFSGKEPLIIRDSNGK